SSVRALADAHASGIADVRLVAISASERQKLGDQLETFSEFQERMASLGLGHLPLLFPMMYWDVTYWDECLWADEQMELLERKLHGVLFPGIPHLWQDYCRERGIEPELTTLDRKWKNAKCDVLAIWSHAFRKRQVFVTTDRNFHKATKKSKLIGLGAGRIETPASAVSLLQVNKNAV
nr:hypothetical protein [Nitrospirales bacterium]